MNDFYANHYPSYAADLETSGPDWLAELRRRAAERFVELGGVPTTKNEEYKYTSLKKLARTPFVPASAPNGAVDVRGQLDRFAVVDQAHTRLVFLDGHFSAELSRFESLPEGVRVSPLSQALETDGEYLKALWSESLADEDYPFAASNLAFLGDGAFIHVPRRTRVEEPIELVFVATAGAEPTANHPRTVVRVEESAELTLIESFIAASEAPYLTNTVLEIDVAENAFVDHYRIEEEALAAYHIALIRLRQGRASNFKTHNFMFGGGLVRNDVHGVIAGEGIETILNGLYLGRGNQHIDNHTTLEHVEPHCHSYELYKGVLDGSSTAVFNGKIFVRKKAQKTDAVQSNKNLLLSPNAAINTKPQLEIWADDVKCTHGATIGQLDSEALFYLRTRGLSRDLARSILTFAFANEVIENVRVEPLKAWLEHELAEWLPRTLELEAAR